MDRAERRRRMGNRVKRAIRMMAIWRTDNPLWARKNADHLRNCSCVMCKRFGGEDKFYKRKLEQSLLPFDPQDLEPDEF